MQVQDGQDFGRRELLGGKGMCAHRHGKILCCQGYQQEDDGRPGAYGTGRSLTHELGEHEG